MLVHLKIKRDHTSYRAIGGYPLIICVEAPEELGYEIAEYAVLTISSTKIKEDSVHVTPTQLLWWDVEYLKHPRYIFHGITDHLTSEQEEKGFYLTWSTNVPQD